MSAYLLFLEPAQQALYQKSQELVDSLRLLEQYPAVLTFLFEVRQQAASIKLEGTSIPTSASSSDSASVNLLGSEAITGAEDAAPPFDPKSDPACGGDRLTAEKA